MDGIAKNFVSPKDLGWDWTKDILGQENANSKVNQQCQDR